MPSRRLFAALNVRSRSVRSSCQPSFAKTCRMRLRLCSAQPRSRVSFTVANQSQWSARPPVSATRDLRPNDPRVSVDAAARLVGVRARAALRVDRDRAAQRVQPERRVRAGNQLDAGDRRLRDQVPVDAVAERLVDAHAVEEDRDALRRAEQRRGAEAAHVDVRLVRVALRRIEADATGVLIEDR